MATNKGIHATLAALSSVFAGELSVEKIRLYAEALADVTDEQLAAAVGVLIKTHTGQWLPVPAQIREACNANQSQVRDVESLLKAIEQEGFYNPNTGWNPPRVEKVRALFGDAVATAYGAVGGGSRLFSANELTREICGRDFGKALEEQAGAPELPALPSETRRALGVG